MGGRPEEAVKELLKPDVPWLSYTLSEDCFKSLPLMLQCGALNSVKFQIAKGREGGSPVIHFGLKFIVTASSQLPLLKKGGQDGRAEQTS